MKKLLLLVYAAFLLGSCMEQDEDSPIGPFPLGSWMITSYQENGFILERVRELPENTFGYIFRKDESMINRSYSGWCATPPVATGDFDGSWKLDGDALLVEFRSWSGVSKQEWKVLSKDNNLVTVEVATYEEE